MSGWIQALLGGGGGGGGGQQESSSPTDSLIKMILGAGAGDANAAPAPTEDISADNPGAANAGPLTDVLPPGVASKVATNPSAYPNLAAILGQKQTKVANKMKPLDYLIAAASPIVSGLTQMMMSRRRSDRAGNFAAGAAGGGLNAIMALASHGPRVAAAQRQQDIENILLQKTLRGAPQAGVDSNTGVGKFEYQTGETALPGLSPTPKAAAVHPMETRDVTDAQGNKIQEEYDQANKVWKTSQMEQPTTDATGKTTTKRVPFMSPKQPEKPSEADINREERNQINDAGLAFLMDSHKRLGQGKKPEEYVNDAVTNFQNKAQGNKRLKEKSSEITTAIRTIGRNVNSKDELASQAGIARAETKQVNQWAVKALADAHARAKPDATPEDIVDDATETFRQAAGTSKALAEKAPQVTNAIRAMGHSVKSGRSVKSEAEAQAILKILHLGDQEEPKK